MAAFNKVVLMGNLTRDPELRHTSGGTAVVNICIAATRKWKDRTSNEMKEETTFVDVTLWGRTAEIADQYLQKGRLAMVEGRLQLDQWEDKETGKNRSRLLVVGEQLILMPNGSTNGERRDSDTRSDSHGEAYQPPATGDDDVPF